MARSRHDMKLEGYTVVDLSMFLPGPHLSMMMADHGATVYRIEPPDGEPTRTIGLAMDGHSVWFRNTHRGKKSVALNLKNPAHLQALLHLVDRADVFIEAFRPGVAARLGLDFQTLAARNPKLVYCSMAAFGQTGPLRERPAHDLAIQAMSGLLSVNLGNDNQPCNPGVPAADMAASLMALSGILMALLRRTQTGLGDYLDISMQDCLMAWTPNVLGPVFAEKRAAIAKLERSWGGNAFYRIYQTHDHQHIALGGAEHKFVDNLLGYLGRPELSACTQLGPGPHQDVLVQFLTDCFLQHDIAHWSKVLGKLDLCWAPVLNLLDAFQQPQVQAREMLLFDSNGTPHVGVPIKFKNEPAQPNLHVPELGENNAELLSTSENQVGTAI
jgi:crotonobetainyl-CoA:carnitine CoA-transferase CaiB-like acyl-CoA transferase